MFKSYYSITQQALVTSDPSACDLLNNNSPFTCKGEIQVPIQQFHDYNLTRQSSASV